MERKMNAMKYAKQRRFLLVLPLLTLPFLTLMFWAFGGGKGNAAVVQSSVQRGLNLKLPDAKLADEKLLNKLSFYQQATLDSVKTREAEKLDPYWNKKFGDSDSNNLYADASGTTGMDANQMKVYNKLDELKKALAKSQETSDLNTQANTNPYSLKYYPQSNEVDRLQAMMKKVNEDKAEDPEITQLNEMLDKIQKIQNPEESKHLIKSSERNNLPVTKTEHKADISLLKPDNQLTVRLDTNTAMNKGNAFYSTTSFEGSDDSNFNNEIEAFVPQTQTIVAGSTIKLALRNDVNIKDVIIPSGSLIYGTTSLSNERLKIAVTSIRFQNSILPVSLNVYDMDGQEGIYVPGSINRTVAKESANNAIGGMNTMSIDPSLGAQAVTAGIAAAKTLASKKIKLVKMAIEAGYKVLLKDNHEK